MPKKKQAPGWRQVKVARGLPWKPVQPAKKPSKPAGIRKAVAVVGVLKADAAMSKAVRSGDRRAVRAAASQMRTAQRRAGRTPAKLASVAEAVKAKAAYDRAVASGEQRAVQAEARRLAPFQRAAAGNQDRDRRGRFT